MNHRQPPNAVFEMWQGRVIRRPFRDVVRRYFVAGACSSVTRLARQGVRASDRIAGTLAMGGDRALDTVTWAVEVAADTVDGVAATVGGAAARNTLRHLSARVWCQPFPLIRGSFLLYGLVFVVVVTPVPALRHTSDL